MAKKTVKNRPAASPEKRQTIVIEHNVNVSFVTPLDVVIKQEPSPSEPSYSAIFTFQQGDFIFEGEHMSNTMQAGTQATLTVKWVDKFGNPAKVDGATAWASSDDTVATVTPNEDTSGASLNSVGPIGPVQIQATADADLGEGVQSITATCDVNVIAGQASGGEIDFEQTPPARGKRR